MTDDSKELLVRYQQGDPAAAAHIFDRYTTRLLALARSRLSPRLARKLDAEDIVQSTYRSFFMHADEGQFATEQDGDLWRLLAAITLHKIGRRVRYYQAEKRSMNRETFDDAEQAEQLARWAGREPSPADVVAVVEETHWLMSQFEPVQRRALELRLQNQTIEEIAAAIDCSERTVRRWLAEARAILSARWHSSMNSQPKTPTPLELDVGVVAPLRYADYRLLELIGSGGMCKVFAGAHKATGRPVAVKVLRKRLRKRPHLVSRFLQEAQIVARFNHPQIVPVHGLGRLPDGGYFMVMDFIAGGDLDKFRRNEELSVARAVAIVASVANAIHHAHERGVIHRDLKPGNVLIDDMGRVFVTDFGFAWLQCGDESSESAIVGTTGFMAPEQVDPRAGKIGPHTDVFGLGALLFMLIHGRPPCVEAIATADQARAPAAVRAIYEKCLKTDWQARFRAAREVAVALTAWLSEA